MASAIVKISETDIGGGINTITLSAIPQGYDDLLLMMHSKSTSTSTHGIQNYFLYNAANLGNSPYISGWKAIWGRGAGTGSIDGGFIQTEAEYLTSGGATSQASDIGTFCMRLYMPEYSSTAFSKMFQFQYGNVTNSSNDYCEINSGIWSIGTTTAMTSFNVNLNDGNWAAGSQISLYGIKGT